MSGRRSVDGGQPDLVCGSNQIEFVNMMVDQDAVSWDCGG